MRARAAEATTIETIVRVVAGATVQVDLVLGAPGTAAVEKIPSWPQAWNVASSRITIPGELIGRLPVDDARAALTLAGGVQLGGADRGLPSDADLAIRGSPAGQGGVYIDGASARIETRGVQGIAVARTALAEASVTPGVAPVEVADARGGVIGFVTRTGGPSLTGSIRADSDEPLSDRSGIGFNWFEGSLGGPIPSIPRLTWSVSGALQGQRSQYRGVGAERQPTYALGGVDTVVMDPFNAIVLPRYVQSSGECGGTGNAAGSVGRDIRDNYSYACRGLIRPFDWSTRRLAHIKLFYSYGVGSSVSLTGLGSDVQRRFFPGTDIGDPALYQGARAWSRLLVLNWGQRLGRLGGGAAGARPQPLPRDGSADHGAARRGVRDRDARPVPWDRAPAVAVHRPRCVSISDH